LSYFARKHECAWATACRAGLQALLPVPVRHRQASLSSLLRSLTCFTQSCCCFLATALWRSVSSFPCLQLRSLRSLLAATPLLHLTFTKPLPSPPPNSCISLLQMPPLSDVVFQSLLPKGKGDTTLSSAPFVFGLSALQQKEDAGGEDGSPLFSGYLPGSRR
jgi:hypothetical protein